MNQPRKAVLVTGGGRGLGRAIGARLSNEGWTVGLLSRTVDEVEESALVCRQGGGEARGFVADVLDPASLERALERFRDWAGRLDALVCAAGRLRGIGPLSKVDPDEWWRDLETSVRGTQLAIRAAWPLLRESAAGSISILVGPGHNGELAFASGYGAAQAALVRLAESLGREFQHEAIPVYAVNPGLVPTALIEPLLSSVEGRRWLPQFTEAFAEGKEVGAEVVAEMIAWLVERRPAELNGRVVAALQSPEILEARLERVQKEDLHRLRLR